jgi:hypothetical protein
LIHPSNNSKFKCDAETYYIAGDESKKICAFVRPIENSKKAPALLFPSRPEMPQTRPEIFSGFQFDGVLYLVPSNLLQSKPNRAMSAQQ